jgi:hypothetical protein
MLTFLNREAAITLFCTCFSSWSGRLADYYEQVLTYDNANGAVARRLVLQHSSPSIANNYAIFLKVKKIFHYLSAYARQREPSTNMLSSLGNLGSYAVCYQLHIMDDKFTMIHSIIGSRISALFVVVLLLTPDVCSPPIGGGGSVVLED